MKSLKLNIQNLSKFQNRLAVPKYDRTDLKNGIVHIGVGGFHRSHQAYYIHQLLEENGATDWAICGVGLRESDRNMANVLDSQDCLYTLVTQDPALKIHSEIIGSITKYLLACDNPQLVIDKMAHPDTRIVSMTITEGGYNFSPSTGSLDFEDPIIQHDLKNPETQNRFCFPDGKHSRKRQAKGIPAFTVLSCDNIQHNGDMARGLVLAFANKQNIELADWIEKEVGFPNAMVDRITPVTSLDVNKYLEKTYGIIDEWPVVCEPFIQWVIEDNFSNGRPPLEDFGVQFVPDVTPYEKMKIRLLNASHSVLGIPGAIHGHGTIDACMRDTVFSTFMRDFMDKEVTPILGEIEGIDIGKYKDTLEERFANVNIKDSVSRICAESSAKLPKFLIPTILENLEIGGSIKYATFVLAAWCFYSDKGIDENMKELEIIDFKKDELHQAAKETEGNWKAFLSLSEIFGTLIKNDKFVNEYISAVKAIYKENNILKLMREI
ncbi:UNVERIFIED_CONTAM: hypothetical protein GTU68_056847 [Idotea baltica]|nr:hypothetical protein [Idotea baltica]